MFQKGFNRVKHLLLLRTYGSIIRAFNTHYNFCSMPRLAAGQANKAPTNDLRAVDMKVLYFHRCLAKEHFQLMDHHFHNFNVFVRYCMSIILRNYVFFVFHPFTTLCAPTIVANRAASLLNKETNT